MQAFEFQKIFFYYNQYKSVKNLKNTTNKFFYKNNKKQGFDKKITLKI